MRYTPLDAYRGAGRPEAAYVLLRRCLEAADRAGFETRRAESRARRKLRGFGFANYLEANGGLTVARMIEPDNQPVEAARLAFGEDGALDSPSVRSPMVNGQDHALPLVRYAAASLGLTQDKIGVR
ncbi:hypothetical protein [Bradyrhizobium sp. ORS 86]|uniref:hypothetical protein n=1 Tax=Bradyrhizobium sp. ORS 86 TaxID=1685970 RepID=UPI003890AF48